MDNAQSEFGGTDWITPKINLGAFVVLARVIRVKFSIARPVKKLYKTAFPVGLGVLKRVQSCLFSGSAGQSNVV